LLGFRQADRGRVLLDGEDISSLDLTYFRNELNVVMQQPFVIPGDTVRQNLDPKMMHTDRILEEVLLQSSLIQQGRPESSVDLD
jgi:ABC-type multidrug transport system fused ATPase/permease subunit